MAVHIQRAGASTSSELAQNEQGDLFTEVLVRQRWNAVDYLRIAGLMLVYVILLGLMIFFIQYIVSFFILIFAFLTYGLYFLLNRTRREYEYIATNGNLDVDEIIARSRRRRIFSAEPGDIEAYGSCKTDSYKDYARGHVRIIDCRSRIQDQDEYFVLALYDGKRTLLWMDASEKIDQNLRRFIPSKAVANP